MKIAILFLFLVCFCSCAQSTKSVVDEAKREGFKEMCFHTKQFTLFGLLRIGRGDTLHVYVEGDGHAWETSQRPSNDPTPRNPVGLRLAVADCTGASVLYLARPFQFVKGHDEHRCTSRYWTSARLSEEVISSLNEAVSEAKHRAGASHVALFGFSGGGGAVVLIAARRGDVAFLATVAGLLDIDSWVARMRVSPLSESLNPLNVAQSIRLIPQLHLCSRDDLIVPLDVARGFCTALGRPDCLFVAKGIAHGGAWEDIWPSFLQALSRTLGRRGPSAGQL